MKNLFNQRASHVATQLDKVVELLDNTINKSQLITPQSTTAALSLEALRDDQAHSLATVSNELSVSLESIASDLGIADKLTEAQIAAATAAGILAGDFKQTLAHKTEFPSVSTESMGVVQSFGVADSVQERSFSLESYDERENRNAVIYSIAYNMQAARQDEFGETFFPTIVVTPDNVGFGITVSLMMVYDGVQRDISGKFTDFKKRNIIRAIADPTVLRKEQTRIVPVVRAQSVANFADPLKVAPYNIDIEGNIVSTAPLKPGVKIDLLGISQTAELLNAGIMDQTDSIDPYVTLQNVYLSVTDGTAVDVLKVNVTNLPLANFTYGVQNNYRVMTLNFQTTSILINASTLQADGTPLVALAAVAASNLILRLEVNMSGTINIETGETNIFANYLAISTVQDSTGNFLDQATAPAAPIVAIVNAGIVEGYELQSYRTNMNRRQRGQLIDVTKYTQMYNVPLRSPITTIHPINTDGQIDTSDVQALITATRIRTSNEAVTALINAAVMLRDYIDARDVVSEGPDILGVGRFYVRPTYYEEIIDMNAVVNSLTSYQRAQDIQSAIVNKVRDYAYRMYRDSEYKAAADAFAGGIGPVPTVIIGTDPVIARYLEVTGDLRTLGGEFDVRIVSTLDNRVAGKVFITFGVFDENRNVSPNPLNFGNMAYGPELVLTANISRSGTISKETVVQPRYLFVHHLPVMTMLTVNNIPNVINKVAINFHTV